ncbi:hypothetical protein ACI65C_008980 [Semiaphis heraclei]
MATETGERNLSGTLRDDNRCEENLLSSCSSGRHAGGVGLQLLSTLVVVCTTGDNDEENDSSTAGRYADGGHSTHGRDCANAHDEYYGRPAR